ncbi:MAG: U32 family peptidase [Actinobacteria bacterium]|nr:MAG: U32 family peptidase [Actinomycetota bacterium]
MTERLQPELLAPAGNPDALVAAINNGADAVYLGLGELNARRGAENFDLETLEAGCRFAHLRGARVYLTANILILPEEMSDALRLIDRAWVAGIDAVIVQDLGLLRAVRATMPHVRVHASTQIDTHDPGTVDVLAGLGVARVTLAREVSVHEIARIVAASPVEVESFIHGALCFSYSGQCLMSSAIGGRSANRGLCAQPCRLQYALVAEDGAEVATAGRHLLSPKDAAGIAHLPALVRAGVAAFKIEGRMKAPEYVAIVVGVYRAALDRAIADPDGYEVTPGEWALLEEAFSRGFTDAYLLGTAGNEMMSYSRPNNRGVPVGRVTAAGPGWAEVQLDRALDAGDTVQFWTSRGRSAQRAGEMGIADRRATSAPTGARVRLSVDEQVSEGDRVFRVANAAMLEAARRTFTGGAAVDHRATPVDVSVRLKAGSPLRIEARVGEFAAASEGPIVEIARTKPVTVDEVIEHVGRVGGTGYAVERWDIDLEHGVGIGFSTLHTVRRAALDALDAARLSAWSDRELLDPRPPKLAPAGILGSPDLVVSVWDAETAVACLAAGASLALLRVTARDEPRSLPEGVMPLLPRVAHADDMDALRGWFDHGAVTAGTLGELSEASDAVAGIHADWPLNATNPWASAALADLGASFVWASPELTGARLKDVAHRSPVPVGALVYGRLELMVSEHCILQAAGECGTSCATCVRRRSLWWLRDQKGYEFPVRTDSAGRSHVFNAVTLDLSRALDEVVATGVAAVRLEMTTETPAEAASVTAAMVSALRHVASGGTPPVEAIAEPATSGHFFRGVR